MLEPEQVKRLIDKFDYGGNVSRPSTTKKQPQPSVAPEIERPAPSEAASSSHQTRQEDQRQNPKGKGNGKRKGGKSSKGQEPTWQRINWNYRSWSTYDPTFFDAGWTDPHCRENNRGWDDFWDEEERSEEDTGRQDKLV